MKTRNWFTKETGLAALVVLAFIFFFKEVYLISLSEIETDQRVIELHPYLVNTLACRIPNLQANSTVAMKYTRKLQPFDCGKPPLVESNDTHLQIVHSALIKYGIKDVEYLSCCYRAMWRHAPNVSIEIGNMNASWLFDGKVYDNDIRYAKVCVPFNDAVEVKVEFVRVECAANRTEIYMDYHGFVPEPKMVPSHVNKSTDENSVNVVIFGIDSLSRLNMIRKMPLTYNYLVNVLGALPMYGYNKVGENTFPNTIPLLSGYSVKELNFCWANNSAKFDLCPFIWKAFNYRGYATAFIEDTAWMGVFLYLKNGFVHQATQYDPRPILYRGEKEAGHKKGVNYEYCIGPRSQIQMLVEYTRKLLKRLHHFKQNHFVYSWGTSFSHDYLNDPELADIHYYKLLKNTYEEGLLNDTIVLFLSDHGLRMGTFLQTNQGQLEGLLPASFMVLPKWFRKKYPVAMKNLRINQNRLITAFDIHQTFYDLMDLRSLTPDFLNTRETILQRKDARDLRGISLFLAVPETRDCAAAGIPAEFCSCRQQDETSIQMKILNKAALLAVGEINARLRPFPVCVPLVLNRVIDGSSEKPVLEAGSRLKRYRVSFETEPGGGLFSALVSHDAEVDRLNLIGELSRLNFYRNSSYCVPETKLRLFCFCVHQG